MSVNPEFDDFWWHTAPHLLLALVAFWGAIYSTDFILGSNGHESFLAGKELSSLRLFLQFSLTGFLALVELDLVWNRSNRRTVALL